MADVKTENTSTFDTSDSTECKGTRLLLLPRPRIIGIVRRRIAPS
ncbi:hypothetical protein L917_10021, partial [Phytophthora nicotianae]